MEFQRQINKIIEAVSHPYLRIKNIWFHLAILILVSANSLVSIGLIEYLYSRQKNRDIAEQTNSIANSLVKDLENLAKTGNVDFARDEAILSQQVLDEYNFLSNKDESTQIVIINHNDLVVGTNFERQTIEHSSSSQDILVPLQKKLATISDLNRSQPLNLRVNQQNFLTQVIPWENEQLNLDWLLVIATPKLEASINSTGEQSNWFAKYLTYLPALLTSVLLTYLEIVLLIYYLDKKRKSKANKSFDNELEELKELEPVTPEKQTLELDNQSKIEIEKLDSLLVKEPYLLLASMSHELRSPLNAILGFAQIIEQELSTNQANQANKENIAIINRSGERLLSIVNDVVDFAKTEINQLTLEHNKIDFYAWLDNIKQNFNIQANNKGWEFSLIKQSNLPQYLCIDERRLGQILHNLVNYCLKSEPEFYGHITLTVTSELSVDRMAQDSSQKHHIFFEVQNSHLSVTAAELDTLFDPMVRVQQEQKCMESSSLNLPLSRKLVQLMGGDLSVSHNADFSSGVTFNLTIQATSVAASEITIQPTVRKIIGIEGDRIEYRILVVDDSKTNRKIMQQLLESVGFQVKEAVNGEEGIDILLDWQPHMIWMDLRMPVMNGCEATERIRSYSHNMYTPIVAFSASDLEEEKSQFKAAGCDDFVGKPFSEKVIFDKIAQHLGIRYLYEPVTSLDLNNFKLTADTLNVMPNKWLHQIEQAAIELNQDLLTQLLTEIPSEHQELKNALQKQINSFDFDKILNLAKNSQNN